MKHLFHSTIGGNTVLVLDKGKLVEQVKENFHTFWQLKGTLWVVALVTNISYGYRRYNICQLKVYYLILEPSANHVVINFTQGSPESLLADTSSQFHGMAKAAGILENHHLHDD